MADKNIQIKDGNDNMFPSGNEIIVRSYKKSDSPQLAAWASEQVTMSIDTISGYIVASVTPFFRSSHVMFVVPNAIGVETPSWDLYLKNISSNTISGNRDYGMTVVYVKAQN